MDNHYNIVVGRMFFLSPENNNENENRSGKYFVTIKFTAVSRLFNIVRYRILMVYGRTLLKNGCCSVRHLQNNMI